MSWWSHLIKLAIKDSVKNIDFYTFALCENFTPPMTDFNCLIDNIFCLLKRKKNCIIKYEVVK